MKVDRSKWPLMVRLGLWGISSRGAAWSFVWVCIALAVACIGYGLVDARFFYGVLFFLSAYWYVYSLRWVDRNSRWS